jgi:signal transduction histidine kinase
VEGDAGQHAYIILSGQIEIYKTSNGRAVVLAVRRAGEVIGEMAILESAPRSAGGRALVDSRLLAISNGPFNRLLDTHPSAVRILLHTVTGRLQTNELLLRQSEKMAQLGLLTAGIAHELNNPSAAVQRGAERVRAELGILRRLSLEVNRLSLSPGEVDRLRELSAGLEGNERSPVDLDPLERSDREDEIENWLEGLGVENAWEIAPALVDLGYEPGALIPLEDELPPAALNWFVRWVSANGSIDRLLNEIGEGSTRMSEIVKALKTYVFLDQGPVQEVDIHEGLENTLVILRFKLKQGITVRREFDPRLPRIDAYGSELNQVWTNIIDNAIDAMQGKGEVILRTSFDDSWVMVEIRDTGPGIPADVLPKLFSPFFTTKAVGKGTGLGLNTSYNIVHKHNGEIKVTSSPGDTRFEVRLPRRRGSLGTEAGS